jgi:uncharacterized protein YndB with AHSA1/START domain
MTEQAPSRRSQQEARMGTIERDGNRVALRYERRLAHPPELVWRALTESEQLRHWFPADIEGERRPGAELVFRFWPETREAVVAKQDERAVEIIDQNPALPGEMLIWEPPRLLELRWDTEVLRYELTAEADGTSLVLTVRLDGKAPASDAAAGYHACLDALEDLLDEGGTARPVAATDVSGLEEQYAALLAS